MDSVTAPFWSSHTHSRFSVNDALPSVEAIVAKAEEYDYPALGLTDHRSISGSVALYKAARKVGIEPLPGIELDVYSDTEYAARGEAMHLCVLAYSETGYRNLVNLATLAHKRYYYKPRLDFADLAAMAVDGATRGLAVTTGCFFGVLPQVLMHQGEKAALQVVNALAGWFPQVYIELQNHGVDEHKGDKGNGWTDDELAAAVFGVHQASGLPLVITRDSHYLEESDKHLHDALKRLVAFSEDVEEATFPGGGYHMTNTEGLKEYFEPHQIAAGLEGLAHLASKAYVRLPELETFTLKVPEVTLADPQEELEEKVMSAFRARYPHEDAVARARLNVLRSELDVIRTGGMASYLLLVNLVCEFMREQGISYHARGSAAGSFVNYLLGITQADPIRFGLRFDRFLSTNRMKPPDVDLDVEHTRRDEVIAFLKSKWSVQAVGSLMKYDLEEFDEGDEGKGSLRVKFYSQLRKQGLKAPAWRDVPEQDKADLVALAKLKLISGYGTHAAGYIVAPDSKALSQLPLAWIASSKKMVTAYGKKDVEQLGFLKLDLLGLRTRTAIRVMCELSGVDFDAIPDNDAKTLRNIGAGRNVGVFQLDGYAMNRGCERLRPRNLEDIIAAQALFRPATINSGAMDDYMARRKRVDPVPQRHADIMNATKDTYGVLLYQEQVMDVLGSLGLNQSELESMLDAVKASNEYTEGAAAAIEEIMPHIRELAHDRGWTDADIDWLAEALGAYADYSFNKAHAASYGVIAYRTAYMRAHHPVAFWTGMLTAYDDAPKPKKPKRPKQEIYLEEARADGVQILGPDINASAKSYSMDTGRHFIRKGFLSIDHIGHKIADELVAGQPYASLMDLATRANNKVVTGAKHLALKNVPADCGGAIAALEEAGALDGLESGWTTK